MSLRAAAYFDRLSTTLVLWQRSNLGIYEEIASGENQVRPRNDMI